MDKNKNLETIVGAGVIVFCIILITFVYSKGFLNSSTGDVYILNASFDRVDGINIGSEVSVSGVKVGEVRSKKLDNTNYSAILQISLQKDLLLPIDTSAEIVSSSLMGDKYIALVPGAETEFFKDGDVIEFTQSSISIEGLITKFLFGMDNTKDSPESNN
jgi:phospholipid/cholesterol/gamma-HCH transport system substrate-binding protein